jgi:hypothetical protein
MIRVTKRQAPRQLATAGVAATTLLQNEYDAAPDDFRTGVRKLKFKPTIFGHVTVRNELARVQFGKCCYCEVKIPVPYALQHVEHYRPKSQSRQARKSAPVLPGYYWLAYDWNNLFLSCHFCNSSNKGDQFPLANEALRVRDHHDPIAQEYPLVLCPDGTDDPELHIDFHEEVPKGLTPRGRSTIEILGLDSPKHEPRLETLGQLRRTRNEIIALKNLSINDPAEITEVTEMIRDRRARLLIAQRSSSPFSAMAKRFLERNPIP